MAKNEVWIDATPKDVFQVLSTPLAFADWVVGAKKIRAVDVGWPRPGTCFHHTFWMGPVTFEDTTKIIEIEPFVRLVLEARTRPIASAIVVFDLTASGAGTLCRMTEEITGGPIKLPVRVLDGLVRLRNARSLRRLKALAEGEPVRRRAGIGYDIGAKALDPAAKGQHGTFDTMSKPVIAGSPARLIGASDPATAMSERSPFRTCLGPVGSSGND